MKKKVGLKCLSGKDLDEWRNSRGKKCAYVYPEQIWSNCVFSELRKCWSVVTTNWSLNTFTAQGKSFC